jgi:hypothetical protein
MLKPRVDDCVERINFKRMFGRVKKIISSEKVEVEWNDDLEPKITTEKIKCLALVKR